MSAGTDRLARIGGEPPVAGANIEAALLDLAATSRNIEDALLGAMEQLRVGFRAQGCAYFKSFEEGAAPVQAGALALSDATREIAADLAMEARSGAPSEQLLRRTEDGVWMQAVARSADAPMVGVLAMQRRQDRRLGANAVRQLQTAAAFCQLILESFQQRAELEEVNARFESLAGSIPGVIYQRVVRSEDDIRYTYISETAKDFFGISAHEILTNPRALFNSYSPEYAADFKRRLLEASRKLSTWDVEASLIMPDGSRKYTHAIAKPSKQADGSVLWTGVILDASRIKKAEREAADTEARTRASIVESLGQGFLMFDHSDELVLSNEHYLSLYPQLRGTVREGASYTELLRAEIGAGMVEGVDKALLDGRFRERLAAHRNHETSIFESHLADNRWVQINEHRTDDGMTVVIHTDVSEIRQREERIHHMALHDSLTGLPNRVYLNRRLEEALAEARRYGTTVSVICIDLDNFKHVNDTLGHPAGDKLLCEAVKRIQKTLRGADTLTRLGGDEFAIVLAGACTIDRITSVSNRIIASIGEPFDLDGQRVMVGASIGAAFSGPDADTPSELMKNADLALYQVKADGKNGLRFFEQEMNAQAQARRLLELDLRRALAENELELHFQPQVDAIGRILSGFEALVRWRHPERGLVPPNEFIGIAEETGLIIPIGDWVMRTACEAAAAWPGKLRVAVNVSPMQFMRRGLVDFVDSTLKKTGLEAHRLELEITESVLLRKTDNTIGQLFALKALGVRIAMDDFGTGYSSLGNLRSFPFDRIKIDKSFVSDLTSSGAKISDAAAIVRAVAGLGVSLGIDTTAEGVETDAQLERVLAEGCSHVQGFLYGRPVPADQVRGVIADYSR